jgi:hypothetical protein
MSGEYFAPRRLEWAMVKVKDFNETLLTACWVLCCLYTDVTFPASGNSYVNLYNGMPQASAPYNYQCCYDNYIVKNIFFNKYKTHSFYGLQFIELPKKVMPWVNKVLKDKNREYLIVNSKGKHFSAYLLSKTLTGLYGIGIDMLRSTYINDVVYGNEQYQRMEREARAMGNSVGLSRAFM